MVDESSAIMRSADVCTVQIPYNREIHQGSAEDRCTHERITISDKKSTGMVAGDCSPPLVIRTKEKRKALWRKTVTKIESDKESNERCHRWQGEDVRLEGLHSRRQVSIIRCLKNELVILSASSIPLDVNKKGKIVCKNTE